MVAGDSKNSPGLADFLDAVLVSGRADEGVETSMTCWTGAAVVDAASLLLDLDAKMGTEEGSGGGTEGPGARVESNQAVIQPSYA